MKPKSLLFILLLTGIGAKAQTKYAAWYLVYDSSGQRMIKLIDGSERPKFDTVTCELLLDQTHYGVIEFMPDSSKICFKLVIDGYVVTNLFKPNHYFDNRGRELFRQRFARGKFLNFYKD